MDDDEYDDESEDPDDPPDDDDDDDDDADPDVDDVDVDEDDVDDDVIVSPDVAAAAAAAAGGLEATARRPDFLAGDAGDDVIEEFAEREFWRDIATEGDGFPVGVRDVDDVVDDVIG